MNLETLRTFIHVARRGSFAAVARDQATDPSSISRIIAQLEEELGLRLFQRTTRRMTLTEAGATYLSRIDSVLQELDAAQEEAATLNARPKGTLRLTASVAFGTQCLVPHLPRFREAFPDLRLELLLSDANLDLVSERIDLAIRLGPSVEGDLVHVKLRNTAYRVCASPQFLIARQAPENPSDLSKLPCLLFTFPDFRSRWLFRDSKGSLTEVPVRGDILISNALALRECALSGLGLALLADWLIDDDLREGRLVDLFPKHHVTATSFATAAWLLYPSRAFLPKKVRVAIDFLKEYLGRR